MNDFTASGGDGYSMFGGPREEGISLNQVLASYLKTANIAKYDTTEPQRMLLGKPAVSERPVKGQQGSKGSESGKDVQPIGDDEKAMNPAKQPATGKVVLLPTHRGTVSSGTEGSGHTFRRSYCIKQRVGTNWLECQCLKVARMRNSYQKLELIKAQAQQRCLY